MASKYRLVILRVDAEPVILKPGGQGERDLVQAVVDAFIDPSADILAALKTVGVGLLRSEATVLLNVSAALQDATLRTRVREAVEAAIYAAKAEVRP